MEIDTRQFWSYTNDALIEAIFDESSRAQLLQRKLATSQLTILRKTLVPVKIRACYRSPYFLRIIIYTSNWRLFYNYQLISASNKKFNDEIFLSHSYYPKLWVGAGDYEQWQSDFTILKLQLC